MATAARRARLPNGEASAVELRLGKRAEQVAARIVGQGRHGRSTRAPCRVVAVVGDEVFLGQNSRMPIDRAPDRCRGRLSRVGVVEAGVPGIEDRARPQPASTACRVSSTLSVRAQQSVPTIRRSGGMLAPMTSSTRARRSETENEFASLVVPNRARP